MIVETVHSLLVSPNDDLFCIFRAMDETHQYYIGMFSKGENLGLLGAIIEPLDLDLPAVIYWHPGKIWNVQFVCPMHEDCPLIDTGNWTLTKRDPPRELFHMQRRCILVSALFSCSNCHTQSFYRAHDFGILAQLSEECQVPFELQHRSGITKKSLDIVFNGAGSGISFSTLIDQFKSCNNDQNVPSVNQLIRLFLKRFNDREGTYDSTLKTVTGTILSVDHTFKIG